MTASSPRLPEDWPMPRPHSRETIWPGCLYIDPAHPHRRCGEQGRPYCQQHLKKAAPIVDSQAGETYLLDNIERGALRGLGL
jgi:hypothetical protein